MKRLLATIFLLGLLPQLGGNELRSETWDAILPTADKQEIRVTYWQPALRGNDVDANAVILVHDLGGSRKDWGTLPKTLSEAGMAVLAIQLRGHGDREKIRNHWTRYEKEEFNAMVLDILAARAFLQKQKKVHIRNIAVIGARLGANLALRSLKEDEALKACCGLSPGLDYRGVKVSADLEGIVDRPIKLVAASEDTYSKSSCEKFAKAGADVDVKAADEDDLDDGTDLLKSHETLDDEILAWLKRVF